MTGTRRAGASSMATCSRPGAAGAPCAWRGRSGSGSRPSRVRSWIEPVAGASADSRGAVAWLSVLKLYPFIWNFAAGFLRDKMEAHDAVLRPSDYEDFLASESAAHPELQAADAGHEGQDPPGAHQDAPRGRHPGPEGQRDFALQRALLPPDVLAAIVADDARWLAGFLRP